MWGKELNIKGPPGPQGPTGADSTVPGPAGPPGATGPQGVQGVPGVKGDKGDTGPTGATGAPGATGATGATGSTGPEGPQGVKGDTGAQGIQGVKGDTGTQGPQGVPGPTGATGADSTVPGPQGPQGIPGPEGPQGAAGTGINVKGQVPDVGDLPPSGNSDGDAYTVLSTGDMWVWDAETGTWINIGHIQGPPGPAGATGAQGPPGATGAQGVPGTPGATGATGPAGAAGAAGAQGPKGDTGSQGIPGAAGATGPAGADSTVPGPTGPKGDKGDTGATGPAGSTIASGVTFTPAGNIAATNVQAAIQELDTEKVAKAGDTMTGVLTLPAGTMALPAITFGDPAAGFYRKALNGVAVSVNNFDAISWAASGKSTFGAQALGYAGSASLPSWAFASTLSSGMYIAGTNTLGFSTAAALRLSISTTDVISTLPVSLPADPTTNLQAATKQYVDGKSASGAASGITFTPAGNIAATNVQAALVELDNEKVAKAGDTMTGQLTVASSVMVYEAATPAVGAVYFGNTATKWLFYDGTNYNLTGGALALPADPTAALQAATKQYVDNTASSSGAKRQYIINGAMQISQEWGSTLANVTGSGATRYIVDQFYYASYATTGAADVQQVVGLTPGGSQYRLRVTVTGISSVLAAQSVGVYHPIEGFRIADLGFGTVRSKSATLSFGVRAPAGTYSVVLKTDTSTANHQHAVVTLSYTIAAGEANTDVRRSLTIPPYTVSSAVWNRDTGLGLVVLWALAAGSSTTRAAGSWSTVTQTGVCGATSTFNFMGTAGNTFELFDVSLTEGTVAPPFVVQDYATEFTLCMRYFHYVGSNGSSGWTRPDGASVVLNINFMVPMRSGPTLTQTTTAPGIFYSGGYPFAVGAVTSPASGPVGNGASVIINGFTGLTPNLPMVSNQGNWFKADARM